VESSKYEFVRKLCIQNLHEDDYLLFAANEQAELELAGMAETEEEFLQLLTERYPVRMLSKRFQLTEESFFQVIQVIDQKIHAETLKHLDQLSLREIPLKDPSFSPGNHKTKNFILHFTLPETN
jgi:hypothetical protein